MPAKQAAMLRLLTLLAALIAVLAPAPGRADPADIDAAARGVVRVVIVGRMGDEVVPLSHGTGFAVTPRLIVTNAHVVRAAAMDDSLRVGIVPAEGDEAVYARIVAVSPRNDLALVELTGGLRLPPLTIAASTSRTLTTPRIVSGEPSATGSKEWELSSIVSRISAKIGNEPSRPKPRAAVALVRFALSKLVL